MVHGSRSTRKPASDEASKATGIRGHYVDSGVEEFYANEFYSNPHEGRVQNVFQTCWQKWKLINDFARSAALDRAEMRPGQGDAEGSSDEERRIFWDLSAGNGEVTNAFLETFEACGAATSSSKVESSSRKKADLKNAVPVKDIRYPGPGLRIYATDPYTHAAYDRRFENLRINGERLDACNIISFEDIIDGDYGIAMAAAASSTATVEVAAPEATTAQAFSETGSTATSAADSAGATPRASKSPLVIHLAVCSYAMHLASAEKLPVLAMNLALVVRKLIIITPHKRPVLEEKWGWRKVDEILEERTRAVLYESTFV
mmetsp:Transcript_86986/g.246637  ORF Transcript_86986/g.246637 Transcript_86986/m.246637 type:complete len:317 (+) Transcript_86986:43-993(+)